MTECATWFHWKVMFHCAIWICVTHTGKLSLSFLKYWSPFYPQIWYPWGICGVRPTSTLQKCSEVSSSHIWRTSEDSGISSSNSGVSKVQWDSEPVPILWDKQEVNEAYKSSENLKYHIWFPLKTQKCCSKAQGENLFEAQPQKTQMPSEHPEQSSGHFWKFRMPDPQISLSTGFSINGDSIGEPSHNCMYRWAEGERGESGWQSQELMLMSDPDSDARG